MKRVKKIFVFIVVILFTSLNLIGQDAVLYSQLFNQPELFNPAVNGTAEGVRIGFFFRDQWMKVDGAPKTMALDAFFPVNDHRLGIGLSAFNQSIGLRESNFLLINASSYIDIDKFSTLAFGIRAGMEFCSFDRNRIISIDNGNLNYQDLNSISPTFNIGLVYKSNNFYLGLSSFQLSFKDDLAKKKLLTGVDLTSGYFFAGNNDLIIYTYAIIKAYFKNFYVFEPGINVYLNDKIGAGIGYRLNESLIFSIKVKLSKRLVMGYSYDYSLSEFSRISNGSNEFHLGYAIGKKNILMPF